MGKYIDLINLEVYQLARQLSIIGWKIYSDFDWETKKIGGFQFIDPSIRSEQILPRVIAVFIFWIELNSITIVVDL